MSELGNPPVGEIIQNKFRVEKILGSGGNGVVAMATHLQLDERVALKFLRGTSSEANRLAEEARATVKLKTDHVVRVIDIGRHNDAPFIVMEYLDGKDLQTLVADSGPLSDVGEAVELVLQACEAVAESHRAGILHRDIKLANLFLVANRTSLPRVKLLDFGIARTDNSASGQTMGTPHYMAPERLLGIDDDPRSDVWALGIVLYELICGEKPFQSDEAVSLIAEILEQQHIAITTIREDVTEKLVAVLDKCLSKDPETRYQSAGELASALASFAPVRAQVHVERALEYGRPPSPPASTPEIDNARRTLAASSRALRASRPRASTTGGASATRSSLIGTQAPAKRGVGIGLWIGAAVVVIGVVGVLSLRGKPAAAGADARPAGTDNRTAAGGAAPTNAWTAVAADSETPGTPSNTATQSASPRTATPTRPVWTPPRTNAGATVGAVAAGGGTQPTRPATTAAAADPTPAIAAPTPPARPTMESDPWKSGGTTKPKMEDNPFK